MMKCSESGLVKFLLELIRKHVKVSLSVLPCVAPLNWKRNIKVIESMVVIFEFFLLAILARVAFTRTDDLILIRKHNNVPIEESDEDEDPAAFISNQNYYDSQVSPPVTI